MVLHGCFDLPQKHYYTVALHAFVGGDAGWFYLGLCSAANRLIGEVVQSQRRPLLGPSPG